VPAAVAGAELLTYVEIDVRKGCCPSSTLVRYQTVQIEQRGRKMLALLQRCAGGPILPVTIIIMIHETIHQVWVNGASPPVTIRHIISGWRGSRKAMVLTHFRLMSSQVSRQFTPKEISKAAKDGSTHEWRGELSEVAVHLPSHRGSSEAEGGGGLIAGRSR
jgi:hypothetical protein